jgi:hypothetical protein
MAAARKTTAAEVPADAELKFSDAEESTAHNESTAHGTDEVPNNDGPGLIEPALEVWREPVYPVNESGVPDSSVGFFPGDDVAFLLEFLEHLAPEQFDRARQRFMQACNEERAAA